MLCKARPEAVSQAEPSPNRPGQFDSFMAALAWLAFLESQSQAVRPRLFSEQYNMNISYIYFFKISKIYLFTLLPFLDSQLVTHITPCQCDSSPHQMKHPPQFALSGWVQLGPYVRFIALSDCISYDNPPPDSLPKLSLNFSKTSHIIQPLISPAYQESFLSPLTC